MSEKSDKRQQVESAVAALSVNEIGQVLPESWTKKHQKQLQICMNGIGDDLFELHELRSAILDRLTALSFSEERARELREPVVRQLLGREEILGQT